MKKLNNIMLLIGIACIITIIPWSVIRSIIYIFNSIDAAAGLRFFINNTLIVSLIAALLLFFPIILFVRSIKHKSVKRLSIASALINGAFLGYELYITINAFRQLYPAFLIVNEAGMWNLRIEQLLHLVKSGQLLFILGCIFVIIGCILSLCKGKRPHDS